MADVRFEHVTKRYGQQAPVITDLNLHVRDGEFMVLVGPSGCGKSTALRMIAGLEEITEGDLSIGERRVNDVAPKDRDIAMVFQNYALYPHMSVYDNMAFALRLRGVPRKEIEQRVTRAAATLGLRDYLGRKPKALSGGQRQRVALGRALVREPKVFLLDEPLSNLDAKLRVQTRAEIARLHQQTQTTFVYVTHDQVEAMTMGDRIAVLNAGDIQQLGTPQELYDTPANLFVAGFIGSPAMNFFAGRLVRAGDSAAVRIGAGPTASTLALSGTPAEHLAGQATAEGRAVVVGIRPEDLHLAPGATDRANVLPGSVEVVEHLGNEQLVYVQSLGAVVPETAAKARETAGDTRDAGAIAVGPSVVARLDAGTRVTPGERVALAVDLTHLHVFDPPTTSRFA
jgi:multiple sugar transport system ATP-binding protein